jgi:hypothetical protein
MVRAVRIANGETPYIQYVESAVDIDKIYRCCKKIALIFVLFVRCVKCVWYKGTVVTENILSMT